MSITAAPITPEDLLAMAEANRFELVDGALVENPAGFESDIVGGEVYSALRAFCVANRTGLATSEASYQCFPDAPTKVRRPDASFIRAERLPAIIPRGNCRIAPDLAVEVVSPNELFSAVREKVREYLSAGVRLVWVVNPPTRSVLVYRADGTVADIGPDGELDGDDVLPGFRCPVASLFPSPRPANQ